VSKETGRSPLDPPAVVDTVLDFANSHAGGRPEQFADAPGLRQWLTAIGFADDAVTEADAVFARELRDALQQLLLAHAGDDNASSEAVAKAERYLERVAMRYPLAPIISEHDVTLRPTQPGLAGAIGSLLAGVATLAQAGVWTRVKACRNPICHEAFFDRSRNASAVYHGPGCASMVSMRAYRERRKTQPD
jgi:predicted RNA-binding Zn ribbon-like protein